MDLTIIQVCLIFRATHTPNYCWGPISRVSWVSKVHLFLAPKIFSEKIWENSQKYLVLSTTSRYFFVTGSCQIGIFGAIWNFQKFVWWSYNSCTTLEIYVTDVSFQDVCCTMYIFQFEQIFQGYCQKWEKWLYWIFGASLAARSTG